MTTPFPNGLLSMAVRLWATIGTNSSHSPEKPLDKMRMENQKPSQDPANVIRPTLLRRFAAMLYDAVLVIAVWLVVFTLVYLMLALGFGLVDTTDNPLHQLYFWLILPVSMGFYLWFWSHGGQTLGMRTWRIKVLREDGTAVSLSDAAVRYLGALVSALPLGLGFFWSLFDIHRRTWHDRLSHTMLVLVENEKSR